MRPLGRALPASVRNYLQHKVVQATPMQVRFARFEAPQLDFESPRQVKSLSSDFPSYNRSQRYVPHGIAAHARVELWHTFADGRFCRAMDWVPYMLALP